MSEHRWRDITGPDLTDDPDWRTQRTVPAFGDGSPASLAAGEINALAPKRSALVVWFELYDGQGVGAAPVSPTPAVSATLEVIGYRKDQAGNGVYDVGTAVVAAPNQRRTVEVKVSEQGLYFVRISSIAGATTDPGSIRVFADQAVVP
jgi:hypothetical protein